MSTIVGTNIEVTNIKYDSDTTAMIVSSTGGGAGTVPQGLCKSWCDYGTTGTAAINNSFNASGLTDHDTGTTTITNTTNMGNTTYVINGMTDTYNDANFSDIGGVFLITHGGDTRATGSVKIGTVDTYNANDKLDFDPVMITIFGDLA